jgi:glycyl-radical enzyme activating protein
MYSDKRCRSCGRCIKACEHKAISVGQKGQLIIDRSICDKCNEFNCTKACLSEALDLSCRSFSVEDLMKILDRDRDFWGADGGVTFGGGEPFTQHQFLFSVLKECKQRSIHTAIETCGYVPIDIFLKGMELIDWAFIDIKHMDTKEHRRATGVDNELILKNIEALTGSHWKGTLVIRMPLIPGFNDDEKNIKATAEFLKRCGLSKIDMLPFHRMGDSKYTRLGLLYAYAEKTAPNENDINLAIERFKKHGIDRALPC